MAGADREAMRTPEGAFCDEPFVVLKAACRIEPRMQYPLLGMKAAEPRCILRASTAERLKAAARMLPAGLHLIIWDAWRPFALQQELYNRYRADIIRDFCLEGLSVEEQDAFIARYVALPRADRTAPPAHTTGGAIDLSLAGDDGFEVPMGTPFDSFSPAAATSWFEDGQPGACANGADGSDGADGADGRAVRDNRRLLCSVMLEAGFTNLESEWWHFDYGNGNWAKRSGGRAFYRGCFTADELVF